MPPPGPPTLNALFVDVAYNSPANGMLDWLRRTTATSEAANLLSIATWPPVWRPQGRLEWTVLSPPITPTVQNARTSPGFWHGVPMSDDTYPPSTAGVERGQTIEHERFVRGPMDLLATGTQYTIATLPQLHRNLLAMSVKDRRRVNRALAWMADGIGASSDSTKIACFVAGLEALLPDRPSDVCSGCGQERYGLTRRVKDFLDEFAGEAILKEYRDGVYTLRSLLVHGARHYEVDQPRIGALGERDADVLKVTGAATAGLLNWLLVQQDTEESSVAPAQSDG